jgi:phosphate transport system protein
MVIGTRAAYDMEFSVITDNLMKMGALVEHAIGNSVDSLKRRDRSQAEKVITDDEDINRLRFDLEERCLTLIATQQPAARDLRAVVAVMSIVVDLERMADHAAGIAKTVILMGDQPLLKPLIDIPRMDQLAREMVNVSLEAFMKKDPSLARSIAMRDDQMDTLYRAIFDELVEIMSMQPQDVERATYLLWCAHNLERIGDRVTNISERVVFMTTGDMQDLNE